MLPEVQFSDAKGGTSYGVVVCGSKCTERTAVMVTPWTYAREESVSNLGRSTSYPEAFSLLLLYAMLLADLWDRVYVPST